MSNHSVPSGAFNARISPSTPTTKPAVEGTPLPAAPTSRFATKNTDLTPSEHRATDLDMKPIRDSVARSLAAHDRSIAEANGAVDLWRVDALALNDAVRAGTMSAADAEKAFHALHPEVTPDQLRGQR